ncbi:glycerol kinase GlpK, partial [Paraburkholderia aspalathi]|nr:glycerol kinase GlpK [Paraburkholderia aspalathi]
MQKFVLAIDQGTTSTRSIVFDKNRRVVGVGQQEFPQHFPQSGWVEHDPEDIWQSTVETCKQALRNAHAEAGQVAAIGITNQRETVVVWEKATGKPIHNAIVWQDRRTAALCERLKRQGLEKRIRQKTGLLLDPYFSASKVAWILSHVKGAKARAKKGELLFGTIDSFLIWRLTAGAVHVTDATNASRTMLFNIEKNCWDAELLDIFGIPAIMLPEVKDCSADFGKTNAEIFGGEIPILGVAGDQQAATIGQACFEPGMMKSTYGTGCFALLNTGQDIVRSQNRLLTTIAYRLDGKTTYALEGSIFVAGAAVQWLRDGIGIIDAADQSGKLAVHADPHQDVYLVPAFVGLGAPHWDTEARGAIYGLTRNSGPAEFCQAALESVAYQTRDLLQAMKKDWKSIEGKTVLRVDGGMVASDWTMQRLADI